ncbi:hypothetical protein ACWOYR_003326 [Vibrio parahaemolyticus]
MQEGVNPNPFLFWQGKKTYFKIDDPVIFTRNDSELGGQNGLLGRIVGFDEENDIVYVRRDILADEGDSLVSLEHLYDLELECAMTFIRLKGHSFIPLSWLWRITQGLLIIVGFISAATRAVEKLIIVGTQKAFTEAIVRPSSAEEKQVYLSKLIERLSDVDANID